MTSRDKLISWLEAGKQVGIVFEYYKDNQKYWSSVGIQKWNCTFKVYIDEILESEMDAENYAREETMLFDDVSDAVKYVQEYTDVDIDKLAPCKGQKIFNPAI